MTNQEILYCILGMFIVSYVPRVLPPFILAKTRLSPVMERWLRYVPTSVFGALVFSEIFISEGGLNFNLGNVNLMTSLAVLAVAVKTKSLGYSIVVGVSLFWLFKNVALF